MTGSGVVLRQFFISSHRAGDVQRVLCAGYPSDTWDQVFGSDYEMVTCSLPERHGTLPLDRKSTRLNSSH